MSRTFKWKIHARVTNDGCWSISPQSTYWKLHAVFAAVARAPRGIHCVWPSAVIAANQLKREKPINPTQNKQTTIGIEEIDIRLKCILPNHVIPAPGFWLIR